MTLPDSTSSQTPSMIKNLNADVSANFEDSNVIAQSPSDTTPCISNAGDVMSSVKESDEDHESFTTEQGMPSPWETYFNYYHPGYDGYFGEMDGYGYHISGDASMIQHPASQADNGSVVYLMPGYHSPYFGFDVQYLMQSSMLPQHIATPDPSLGYFDGGYSPFFVANEMHGSNYSSVTDNVVPSKGFESDAVLTNGKFFYPATPISRTTGKIKTSEITCFKDSGLVNERNQETRTTSSNGALVIRKDQYNLPDFECRYDHALFFVIKSYSEDDVHKSIKYNVWASTPNGNKKLNGAYKDAGVKMAEKGIKCPVFLFFSVNASGQFCGVAEMIGQVDFAKNMEFWQQDKWTGFFNVKWHIIKDVPNPQFRHVILHNNDHKPVTNSRDTQEVRFGEGTQMLQIFKAYASKTSILDDFDFYETREKVMRDRRMKLHVHLPKGQVDEVVSGVESVSLSPSDHGEERPKGGGYEKTKTD